jgi:hypothetical protein
LKVYIPRPNADHNAGVWDGARNSYDGRGSGNNRRFGFIARNGTSGSDKEDWRKKNDTRVVIGGKGGELDASVLLENSKGNELNDVEENIIAEPLPPAGAKEQSNAKESEHISIVQENGKETEDGEGAKSFVIEEVVHGVGHTAVRELDSETVPMHIDRLEKGKVQNAGKNKELKRYKKVVREKIQEGDELTNNASLVGNKHVLLSHEEDERLMKKGRNQGEMEVVVANVCSTFTSAGLLNQPRREQ